MVSISRKECTNGAPVPGSALKSMSSDVNSVAITDLLNEDSAMFGDWELSVVDWK